MTTSIKDPEITKLTNGLRLAWPEIGISATAIKIKRLSDSRILCQLEVETTLPSFPPRLYYGDYSMLSLSHRRDLERLLKQRCDQVDWFEILQQISSHTNTLIQRGEPIIEVDSAAEVSPVQHFIKPFLPLNHPTVLYGDGGTCKSYIAAMFAVAARIPWINNNLDMTVPPEPAEVLYLDYETCLEDFQRRISKICKGNNLPDCTIRYRRCYEPLTEEIDDLKDLAHADLIVIDSIGAACAGDLHGSDVPTRFFNALRKFNTTVLLTYHQNKEKEMYGNRFFFNYARSIFEVRKVQNTNDPTVDIGMLHQKYNEGALNAPFAMNIEFTDDGAVFAKQDIMNIPELLNTSGRSERRMTTKDLAVFSLGAGPMTKNELAEDTGVKPDIMKTTLNRYKDTFEKNKNGELWQLKKRAIETEP